MAGRIAYFGSSNDEGIDLQFLILQLKIAQKVAQNAQKVRFSTKSCARSPVFNN